MPKLNRILPLLLAFSLVTLGVGCPSGSGSDDDNGSEQTANGNGDDSHAHGHSHAAPGPEGGHILEIGDEEYHVEWIHDEDEPGVITFVVRDAMAKEEVPIAADKLIVEFTTGPEGAQLSREVDIPGVGQNADNPKTARFELNDRIAVQNILSGEDVTAVLKLSIDGKQYEKEIEHHAHGHGHSHGH